MESNSNLTRHKLLRHLRALLITAVAFFALTIPGILIWQQSHNIQNHPLKVISAPLQRYSPIVGSNRVFSPTDLDQRIHLIVNLRCGSVESCAQVKSEMTNLVDWYRHSLRVENYPESIPQGLRFLVFAAHPVELPHWETVLLSAHSPWYWPESLALPDQSSLVVSMPGFGIVIAQQWPIDSDQWQVLYRSLKKMNKEHQLRFYLQRESNFNLQ